MAGSTDSDTTDLARRTAAGDGEAFLEMWQRFSRPLFGTALRMLGSHEEAEDVIQETFIRLLDGRWNRVPDNPAGWLHRVTVNGCLDRLRRRSRRPEEELDETSGPLPDPPAGAAGLDLERAVARLPERARQIFLLHDVEGFKHHEVAKLLGITTGTSKSQLFRARELLRGHLDGGPAPVGGGA